MALTELIGTCVCVFRMDKLHMALTELCFAINYCSVITVWEHGFVPRDFFTQHLELRFNKYTTHCHVHMLVARQQQCSVKVRYHKNVVLLDPKN